MEGEGEPMPEGEELMQLNDAPQASHRRCRSTCSGFTDFCQAIGREERERQLQFTLDSRLGTERDLSTILTRRDLMT